MNKNKIIYFDEKNHKYTDNLGNPYISCTTLVANYYDKFDSKEVAKNCEKAGRMGNPKYIGKTAKQLIEEWDAARIIACARGNDRHDFLEHTVKNSNGYKRVEGNYINDRIYTIPDILENDTFGKIELEYFVKTGIKDKYPQIYILLEYYTNEGYKIYSEIGAFNSDYLISGLIDILLVKGNSFIILDWKTNRDNISELSGYYEKDEYGNVTDNFIETHKYFSYPLCHLTASTKNKYTLQLSIYNYLIEGFGLKCASNILCHIRHELYDENDYIVNTMPELIGKEKIEFLSIKYLKEDVQNMFEHYKESNIKNNQIIMMI